MSFMPAYITFHWWVFFIVPCCFWTGVTHDCPMRSTGSSPLLCVICHP